ncbi:hypothetical protein V2G26_009208 [Clonostachys chloroleuca]
MVDEVAAGPEAGAAFLHRGSECGIRVSASRVLCCYGQASSQVWGSCLAYQDQNATALEAARVMWVKEKQTRNPDTRNKSGNRGGRQTIGLR